MDHHCPWINCCVGHQNQTSFVAFLFFLIIGCIHAVIINANFLYRLFNYVSEQASIKVIVLTQIRLILYKWVLMIYEYFMNSMLWVLRTSVQGVLYSTSCVIIFPWTQLSAATYPSAVIFIIKRVEQWCIWITS